MSVNIDATTARVNSPAKKKTRSELHGNVAPSTGAGTARAHLDASTSLYSEASSAVMQGRAGRRNFFDRRGATHSQRAGRQASSSGLTVGR